MRKFVMDAIASSPRAVPLSCIRAVQSRYNNNYIAFLLDQRSRGRDKSLGISITDILRLTGEC